MNSLSPQTAPVLRVSNNGQATVATLLQLWAHASQSGDMTSWEDSTPAILSRINKAGYFMTRKLTAPADVDLATSEMALWFDNTIGAAKLMIKGKDSAGTIVSGSVNLT